MIRQATATRATDSPVVLYDTQTLTPPPKDWLADVLPIGNSIVLIFHRHLQLYQPDRRQVVAIQEIQPFVSVLSCVLTPKQFVLYFPEDLRVCVFQTATLQKESEIVHSFLSTAESEPMVHHLFSFQNSPLFCLTRRKYISSFAYYFDGGCRQAGEVELRGLGLKFDEEGSLVTYVQNCRERIELDIYSLGRENTHCNMLNPIGRNVMVAYVRALSEGEFVVVINDREAPPSGDWLRSSWMIGNIESQVLRVVRASSNIALRILGQSPRGFLFIQSELSFDDNRAYLMMLDPQSFDLQTKAPVWEKLLFNVKEAGEGYFVSYDEQAQLDCDSPFQLNSLRVVSKKKLWLHLLLELHLAESFGQEILAQVMSLL